MKNLDSDSALSLRLTCSSMYEFSRNTNQGNVSEDFTWSPNQLAIVGSILGPKYRVARQVPYIEIPPYLNTEVYGGEDAPNVVEELKCRDRWVDYDEIKEVCIDHGIPVEFFSSPYNMGEEWYTILFSQACTFSGLFVGLPDCLLRIFERKIRERHLGLINAILDAFQDSLRLAQVSTS